MITLTSLSTQLNDQLFSANYTTVPVATRTEAMRQTLGQINDAFAATYVISGLDGASTTTLPDTHVPALLLGASAFILDFTIRSRLVSYLNTPTPADPLVSWAKSMKQDFELALNHLRLVDLQQSTNPPTFQIPSENNSNYSFTDV